MPTLADYIFEPTRILTYQVRVNGILLVSSAQATALNELTGVPAVLGFSYDDTTASIDINRCSSWMRAGQLVTIDCGFNGLMQRVWSGYLVALPGEDPDYLRDKVLVKGATTQVGTPPDDVPVELTAEATLFDADVQPPLPAGTNIEHEISVPLAHDSTRLSQIAVRELGRYGVVPRRPSGDPQRQTLLCGGELRKAARAYQLDAIDLSGFTDEDAIDLICELVGITKRSLIEPPEGWYTFDVGASVRRGRPLDMLGEIMKVGGLEAYHTEDGTVIFRQVEFLPGPSHAWEYDVQDQDLARIISATGELEVTWNPFVRKYSTGLLNIPFLNINSSRVFARNVRHSISDQGTFTYIDAWGGDRLGGTVAINPIAAFTFLVEREVIGDGVKLVYFVDASASFDPDGSIASYAWSSNRTTIPAVLPSTQRFTFRVPADVAVPLTLSLTVTDTDSLTHTMSVDLPTTADAPEMQVPAIYAGLENRASASPDGGGNWYDISGASGDEVSVDAKQGDGINAGIACFGYTDGSIKRTTDFCSTTLTTVLAADAANGTINEVWWDKNLGTRVWACTSTGRLLRSDNDGVAWVVHKDFGGTYPLLRIATPLPGGVWVFGGRGDVTSSLFQYEAIVGSGVWASVAIGGELATAISGAASSLHVRSAASRVSGELIVLFNGTMPAGSQDNIFYTADVFSPTGAGWLAATGLTAGLTDGREIVPDTAQGTFRAFFGNRSVWNTTNGIAFTETTNVLPANFAPNRVLWLGDYTGHGGTYLIAAEDAGHTGAIYKWLAAEATADELRPATGFATWPTSADGRAIAIGAGGLASQGVDLYAQMTGGSQELLRSQGAVWEEKSTDTANENWHLKNINNKLYRIADKLVTTDAGGPGDLERSTDYGATWTIVIAKDADAGIQSVCSAADGSLYALWGSHSAPGTDFLKVYKSTDDGANWTLIHTSALALLPIDITAHPTNQYIIVVSAILNAGSANRLLYSTDGGVTFTARAMGVTSGGLSGLWVTYGDGNRILVAGGGTLVQVTDDAGVSWSTKDNPAGTASAWIVKYGPRILWGLSDSGSNGGSVRISTDNGNTWAEYVTGNSIDSGLTTGVLPYGVVVDQTGGLCIAFSSATITDAWWRNPDPWNPTLPAWESIAFNADALATGAMSLQGLAGGPDR